MEAFLTRIGHGKLACLDDTGHPYIVPLNAVYHDGLFYLAARERSAWRRFLQQDGRVCLNLEDGDQRAQVQGYAEYLEGPLFEWPSKAPILKERAEQEGWADSAYVRNVLTYEPMYYFVVRPTKITTWQGEEWAKRYKHAEWSET